MRQLLNDLPKRGPKAYNVFIKSLKRAGYIDVASHLMQKLQEINTCGNQDTSSLGIRWRTGFVAGMSVH